MWERDPLALGLSAPALLAFPGAAFPGALMSGSDADSGAAETAASTNPQLLA